MTMFQALRADAKHYNYSNGKRWFGHTGFWVVATYRFGHWAGNLRFKLLGFLLLIVYYIVNFPVRFVLHVDLPRRARIGGGLCLHHPQNIIVPSETAIGEDVTIYQEVTIGRGPTPGLPQIGGKVVMYAGAKVLGGVEIGDDCEIGANVVVTKDVPSHSVVAVAPSRAIPKATIEIVRNGGQGSRIAPIAEENSRPKVRV
jgi:serine O-acetyltransferase